MINLKNKKYISIKEVSELLSLNSHVIRYWDSKFEGLSTRLNNKKQRFFNQENIKMLFKLKKILYQNGKQNYSFDLASKLIEFDKQKFSKKLLKKYNHTIKLDDNLIGKLKQIQASLKKLLNL